MELKKPSGKIHKMWMKYRYPTCILLIGVCLMLFPIKSGEKETVQKSNVIEQESMEERLESILSGIDGVGKVDVLLSIAKGETVVYQTDEENRGSDSEQTNRTSTVTVTQSDREEKGLIRQVDPPEYLGAVIACQGAANANIRLAVVEAVSKATGLGADCIAVVKMK